MKLSTMSLVSAVLLCSATAWSDGVSVVRGQFTDHVVGGRPQGDAASAAASREVVYWMEVANAGAPAAVTVVWRVGGREVLRQSLDVGRAPRWRTWATLRRNGARAVEVQVLDAAGASLHTDRWAAP
ncbi:MAG: DUF2914 domain-containing protein [Deltaproteobacteria bacterium]|nr:DUF2914 domain-containing protein [Deltaproteobacteria bacterium]MBK7070335.1 DUF2914 domain-containing protein [Deltaproteobacteria bacterium]MBK8697536.1 DUF2914 domain-containing protein [Deltaproteobacteria bacterium]